VTIIDARSVLDGAASQRRLLDHPFYRAWQAGHLTRNDLADYAEQYRHVEEVFPAVLAATAEKLPAGRARRLVEGNLADERSRPRPHLELFDNFAAAVDADTTRSASPGTAQLVAIYLDAAEASPVAALAIIGAYEVQAAEVAATKAASLLLHYHLDAVGVEFWTVHSRLEDSHANWTAEAILHLRPLAEDVSRHAETSVEAWWTFLDEREAGRRG
jgi:pyrroloquinoline-quinone synthase